MKQAERLCPQCSIPMEEVPVKAEPNAIPKVAAQHLDDVKAGVVVTRLECPKCQHVEGRYPKGAGTWKDIQGKSAG
jgi:ribosomal protein S27AE